MRVLVCGDRNYSNVEKVFAVLDALNAERKIAVIIEGEARGADRIGRQWAEARGVTVMAFPANWTFHGRAAGPIRNSAMLLHGNPDKVVAFHPDLDKSKGTKNMVTQAAKALVETTVYR